MKIMESLDAPGARVRAERGADLGGVGCGRISGFAIGGVREFG
jgi:hypothetical protein